MAGLAGGGPPTVGVRADDVPAHRWIVGTTIPCHTAGRETGGAVTFATIAAGLALISGWPDSSWRRHHHHRASSVVAAASRSCPRPRHPQAPAAPGPSTPELSPDPPAAPPLTSRPAPCGSSEHRPDRHHRTERATAHAPRKRPQGGPAATPPGPLGRHVHPRRRAGRRRRPRGTRRGDARAAGGPAGPDRGDHPGDYAGEPQHGG